MAVTDRFPEYTSLTDTYSSVCATALGYHSLGIGIVQLYGVKDGVCRCHKGANCEHAGKHPVNNNWTSEPIRSDHTIKVLYERSQFGVGLLCGETFWVLDIDAHNGGLETLEAWEQEHGKLNPGWIARTPRGGYHYFFACSPDTAPPTRVGVAKGIDTRSTASQVAVYPTVTDNGKYQWHKNKAPFWSELTEAPSWLLEKVGQRLKREAINHNDVFAGLPEGERNDKLFRFACSLRGQGVELEFAKIQILAAAASCKPPLPEREALQVLESAYGRYPEGPKRFIVEVKNDEQKVFNQTDLGNAERLIWRLDGNVRWCHSFGKWLWWNGNTWQVDETGGAVIIQEAARMVKDLKDPEYSRKCESRSKLTNCVELAKAQPGVAVSPDDLDCDPWKFAVANGTINLATGELEVPNKDDLITQCSPVSFDPSAECPIFETFLEEVLQGDEQLMDYIQSAMGYTLTGLTQEHCLFFAYGSGANGKSTFLDCLSHMMGSYGRSIPSDDLSLTNANAEATLARLKGARMVRCSETGSGRLHESLIKELVDGSPIQARMKYGHPFEFRPIAKFWWAGNQKPRIVGSDHGIWRRIRLLPFEYQVPEGRRDGSLHERLKADEGGILNWALLGLEHYRSCRMPDCDKVKEGTEGYKNEMDTIAHFIEEACDIDEDFSVPSSVLHECYVKWCKKGGHYPLSSTAFPLRMVERGFKKSRGNTGVRFNGLKIREESGGTMRWWTE